jgi:hypothetical protein
MSGPDLVMAFKLKKDTNDINAITKIADGIKRFRGFDIENLERECLTFDHQGFEFYVCTIDWLGLYSIEDHSVILLVTDSDSMFRGPEEDIRAFWKAFQNAVAVVVAQADPLFGLKTDADSMEGLINEGLEKYATGADYFSFDYIKSDMPGCEVLMKEYATRELEHGYLVNADVMPEKRAKEFYTELKKNCGKNDMGR